MGFFISENWVIIKDRFIMLLDIEKTIDLLKRYKIPVLKTEAVRSRKEAMAFAEKFGYPVVLKVFAPDILHRTERRLVKVDIKDKEELNKAFGEITKNSSKIKDKKILIQKMGKGLQVICGMKRDPTFGSVLMFGLGGVFVEVLKDVTFGIAPLTKNEAMGMIKKIKGYEILKGYRGGVSANLEKISELLTNLSKLAEEREDIKGVDLNPVFVDEKTIKVADPKIIV